MESNPVYRDGNGQPTDEPSLRAAYAEELQAEVVEAKPEPPKPFESFNLTSEERLQAANYSLTIQLLTTQKEAYINAANARVNAFNDKILETRRNVTALQKLLEQRYNLDFSKYNIDPETGAVTAIS